MIRVNRFARIALRIARATKLSIDPASSIRTSIADPVFADTVSETPRRDHLSTAVQVRFRVRFENGNASIFDEFLL